MWRVFWTSAAIVGCTVVFLVWTAVNATFLFKHPRTAGHRVEIDKRTGAAVVMQQVGVENQTQLKQAQPQAIVDESQFDFGTMDPLTMGKHEFVVHNRGSAPLKLEVGPTTCKCTVSGLSRNVVPVGETGTITLEWNTGREPHYSHAGSIETNDPAKRWLEFRVSGRVRRLLGVDDPEITVESIEPERETIVDRLLFSQIWDGFTLQKVDSTIPGLKWEFDVVDPSSTVALDAKSVGRLRLKLPADLPQGEITDSLRVFVQPTNPDTAAHHVDIPLRAKVLKRLAVYGSAIDESGIIDLGTVQEGKGARVQLLVKVRDAAPDLSHAKLNVSPPMLSARLEPMAGVGARGGLYRLIVELDPDSPPCAYRSLPLGQVSIDSGNPRIGKLDLGVMFVVIPRQPL